MDLEMIGNEKFHLPTVYWHTDCAEDLNKINEEFSTFTYIHRSPNGDKEKIEFKLPISYLYAIGYCFHPNTHPGVWDNEYYQMGVKDREADGVPE